MYYFDDETGQYKKIRRIPYSTLAIFAVFSLTFAFFVYRERKNGDIRLTELRNENKELMQAFTVINEELQKNRKILQKLQEKDELIYRSILLPEHADMKFQKVAKESCEIDFQSNIEGIEGVKKRMEQLNYDMMQQEHVFYELQRLAIVKKNIWASRPAILPVKSGRATSGFGYRVHPIYKTMRKHKGIDIANKVGTPVMATGAGVVTDVGSNRDFGIYVKINHGFGLETVYAHLDHAKVRKHQKVTRGQIIGGMGNTGLSTGTHLHYEVLKNGQHVNPISYVALDFTPKEYVEIMKINNPKIMSMD